MFTYPGNTFVQTPKDESEEERERALLVLGRVAAKVWTFPGL
jgi:hypothetical protein